MTPSERANKFMLDWFGKRWEEDTFLLDASVGLMVAFEEAIEQEREACAQVADAAIHARKG